MARTGIHRVHVPAEAAGHEVVQDRAADRADPAARAHNGDRGRLEKMAQARHICAALPERHRLQVAVQMTVGVVAGEREGEVNQPVGQLPLGRKPGGGEHAEHGGVGRERLGGERGQLAAPGDRDQMLEQEGRDTAAVHVVGDGESYFSGPWRARWLVTGYPDELVAQPPEQRGVIFPWCPADPFGLLIGRMRAEVEKPQVDIIG